MKIRNLLLPVVLAISTSVMTIKPVSAYSYSGIHWNSISTTFDKSSLDSTWQLAIGYAAGTWNSAGANFVFVGDPNSDFDWTFAYWPNSGTVGLTTVLSTNNIIYSCDTAFNTWHPFASDGSWDKFDIQSVALHEFGHWLELNDLWNFQWPWDRKVMFHEIAKGDVLRNLHQDDINGINAIYP